MKTWIWQGQPLQLRIVGLAVAVCLASLAIFELVTWFTKPKVFGLPLLASLQLALAYGMVRMFRWARILAVLGLWLSLAAVLIAMIGVVNPFTAMDMQASGRELPSGIILLAGFSLPVAVILWFLHVLGKYKSNFDPRRKIDMANPETDGMTSSAARARHGLAWWGKLALIAVALIVLIAIAVPAYNGYRPRALISEALIDGDALRTRVAAFHQTHGRLPQPSDATAFQTAPPFLKRAQSVVWDPASRTIVITVGEPQPGKRVALHAEERDGVLTWTCRPIDLDPKFLPGSCR